MGRSQHTQVQVYTNNGKRIGTYLSVGEAAKANDTSSSVVSLALKSETHYSIGKYWLHKGERISTAMKKQAEKEARKKSEKRKRALTNKKKKENEYVNLYESVERRGEYIFIKSGLPGGECCLRCALQFDECECLPCRKEDNHDNGYWRYCKKMIQ